MNRTLKQAQSSTVLSYALLGLIHQRPCSGYDLRKVFSETAMGNYSDSPGSIYPALRRLQERKLVSAQIERGAGLRRRRVLRLTKAGLSELTLWLRSPVDEKGVTRHTDEWMLRFSFCDRVLGTEETIAFLESFERALKTQLPSLREFLTAEGPKMALSGRLALESGVLGYEAQLKWVAHAIKTYKKRSKEL